MHYLFFKHTLEKITEIYHEYNGVDGYRSMKVYLERKGHNLSNLAVYKYMNVELGLYSIVRKKRPDYRKGTAHRAKILHSDQGSQYTSKESIEFCAS